MKKPFLTAEWRHLILLTYGIDPEMLTPYIPKGLEPDIYDGRAFVSFVAFDFLNTKVKGLTIPFHVNFPEINLRFYVRQPMPDGSYRRGVVFIKELVPKYCIALVADKIYNEPYEAIPMTSSVEPENNELIIKHNFEYNNRGFDLKFTVENAPYFPKEDSTAHFFKEHEWGYGTTKKGNLMTYRVEHPFWKIYPISKRFYLNVDYGYIYGEDWAILNGQIPYSIVVAEGSPIKVFPGQVIKTETNN